MKRHKCVCPALIEKIDFGRKAKELCIIQYTENLWSIMESKKSCVILATMALLSKFGL